MNSFLEEAIQHIQKNVGSDLRKVLVLVPSKRAMVFFKEHFSKAYKQTAFLPIFNSIDEYASSITGQTLADPIDLIFEFYDVYCSIEKDDPQPFDEFMQWAPTLIKDFSDIDSYLLDTDDFFSYVYKYFELQQWSPSPHELTDFQKKYILFWKSLSNYYNAFKNELSKLNVNYQGGLFRDALNKLKRASNQQKKWDHIYFLGFNALTKCEEEIFSTLQKTERTTFLFDYDKYYTDSVFHEAGNFIRKYQKHTNWVNNEASEHYKKTAKKINIRGLNNIEDQAYYAGNLISQAKERDTVVVLADENILETVLLNIPKKTENINITLGYPFKNSVYYNFILLIFDLHIFYQTDHTFYYKHVIQLLKHPVLALEIDQTEVKKLEEEITKKNIVRIKVSLLQKHFRSNSLLLHIFTQWESPFIMVEKIIELLLILEQSSNTNALQKEYLFIQKKVFNKIWLYVKKYDFLEDITILKKISEQILKNKTIPFVGEPLNGLQVMGMLETRLLDFEHIIMLSTNEGVLPKDKFEQTFIPYEIKRYFHLATYKERDSVFAYHFYRLLQRAEKIDLLYTTNTSNEGSNGEPSRFIQQLEYELPKHNPNTILSHEKIHLAPVSSFKKKEEVITKTPFLIDSCKNLLKNGISPTAITTYLNCPLDFYYKYILGTREDETVEEDIEDKTLGTIIHNALHQLLKPFLNQPLNANILQQETKRVKEIVDNEFNYFFGSGDYSTGKNQLRYQLTVNIIKRFIHLECKRIEHIKAPISPWALEQKMECTLKNSNVPIKLRGTVDRIDHIHNGLHVIDYKTGTLKSGELKLKYPEQSKEKLKAFQLLFYSYMLYDQQKENDIKSSILYLKNLSDGYQYLTIDGFTSISKQTLDAFEGYIKEIVDEMLNPTIDLQHNIKSTYCKYC